MTFDELGLSEETLRAVRESGYTEPTPIQAKAIPIVLMARDIVGLAQTGTGKTAGFTLPMIDALSGGRAKARMPRSLILEPTRELASQVADNFDKYGKYHKLTKALLVGGESMAEQTKLLDKGVDVLIATPGRLLDLFDRGAILLNDIRIFVIDEADRMLDMGFIPDIEKIVAKLPANRQTLFFSATMPPEIKKLTAQFLSNPKEVSVAPPASPAETVTQFQVPTAARAKNTTLYKLIRKEDVQNAFIFCNRKRDVDSLAKYLKGKKLAAAPLHGDMVQSKRTETLAQFKAGEIDLLVCSDVAGRGIDISGVSHVFNYDVPFGSDDYVHRIGRTGRAGKSGRAFMLVTPSDDKLLEAVEKLISKSLPVYEGLESEAADGEDDETEKPSRRSRDSSSRKESSSRKKEGSRSRRATGPKEGSRSDEVPQRKPANDGDSADVTGFGDEVPAFFKN